MSGKTLELTLNYKSMCVANLLVSTSLACTLLFFLSQFGSSLEVNTLFFIYLFFFL